MASNENRVIAENEFWSVMGSASNDLVAFMAELDPRSIINNAGRYGDAIEIGGTLLSQSSDGHLPARELAEVAGEFGLGAIVTSVVVGGARGLGFGPVGVVAGILVGIATGPLGKAVGGWLYDLVLEDIKNPVTEFDPIIIYLKDSVDTATLIRVAHATGDTFPDYVDYPIDIIYGGYRAPASAGLQPIPAEDHISEDDYVIVPSPSLNISMYAEDDDGLSDGYNSGPNAGSGPASGLPPLYDPTADYLSDDDDDDDDEQSARELIEQIKDEGLSPTAPEPVYRAPVPEIESGTGQAPNDPGYDGPQPILLDLDGNGIRITEQSRAGTFVDAGGDGLQHRTAWAGAGDGVLFYDPDSTGAITEKRQYVFTEWDPTATDDLAALRSVFDSNGDGVLNASDAAFASFKVMVTNADGSTTAMTLAQLGITEINLTADATRIVLPDGSVISGQTSFTRSNGSTGTVANATLVAEEKRESLQKSNDVGQQRLGRREIAMQKLPVSGGLLPICCAPNRTDAMPAMHGGRIHRKMRSYAIRVARRASKRLIQQALLLLSLAFATFPQVGRADQVSDARAIAQLLSFIRYNEHFGGQPTTATIDKCHMLIESEYTKTCTIPGKIRKSRRGIDLTSVGDVTSKYVNGDYMIDLAPRSIFGLILPSASVRSEGEYQHCGGDTTRAEEPRHIALFLPIRPEADLVGMLTSYLSTYCRN